MSKDTANIKPTTKSKLLSLAYRIFVKAFSTNQKAEKDFADFDKRFDEMKSGVKKPNYGKPRTTQSL